jgi:hypothetical protein
MMNEFADDWEMLERYTLQGIEALNRQFYKGKMILESLLTL